MAFGNEGGLVLVDIVQKSVLLSMASSDLYSSADPYTRLPRSPKRPGEGGNSRAAQSGDPSDEQSVRSSSCDQVRSFLISFLGSGGNGIAMGWTAGIESGDLSQVRRNKMMIHPPTHPPTYLPISSHLPPPHTLQHPTAPVSCPSGPSNRI